MCERSKISSKNMWDDLWTCSNLGRQGLCTFQSVDIYSDFVNQFAISSLKEFGVCSKMVVNFTQTVA